MIVAHEGLGPEQRECFSVVLELALALEDWRDRVCLVGGWAIYALTELFLAGGDPAPMRHRGSLDVDIAVGVPGAAEPEAEALASQLAAAGYEGPEGFHWLRRVPSGRTYRLDMMALPPPEHSGGVVRMGAHEFAPLWHGKAAFVSPRRVMLRGVLPSGQPAEGQLRVANPGGLLVVKAWTMSQLGRAPQAKHLYDIFALLRTYPGGPAGFWRELEPLRGTDDLQVALDLLGVMFVDCDDGPRLVAEERAAQQLVAEPGGPGPSDRELQMTEARTTVERFLGAGPPD